MAIKTTGYWDDPNYDRFNDFNTMWGYGNRNATLGPDFVFDPKNPPSYGCTEFHPPLALKVKGSASEIYGSSCIYPNVDDADVYVSLDSMGKHYDWEHPWENSSKVHIRYFIKDGNVPENFKQFDTCVDYVIDSLAEGKKVHVGCIAGHGRTGLFLAAVAQKTMGDILAQEGISAIDYVRDNYCGNAVETFKQVLYLYGVYDVEPPIQQAKRVKDFEEIFTREMGVDFKTVVKETEFMSILKIIQDIDREISIEYASLYKPTTVLGNAGTKVNAGTNLPDSTKPRRELTLAQQELEDLFYTYNLKTVADLDLNSPQNPESNLIVQTHYSPGLDIDIKDMSLDFEFGEGEAEPFESPTTSSPKFSFGKTKFKY